MGPGPDGTGALPAWPGAIHDRRGQHGRAVEELVEALRASPRVRTLVRNLVRPSRSAKCRSYRLGSALVDSAVCRCSACGSPVGGRSGMASGISRLGARVRVGPHQRGGAQHPAA